MQNQLPTVSVVIPVRNEEKYIAACLDSVIAQDYPKDKFEVILALGRSQDKTEEIIARYCERYSYIKMIENPKGTISCGVNLAIKCAENEYIVRFDAHTEFASDYVSKCIEYHLKTGAENVGGPTVVKGKNPVQRAVAAAYYSPFALGGGKQHINGQSGGAGHEGRDDHHFLSVMLGFQRTGSHDGGHRTAKAKNHRHIKVCLS